MTPAFDSIAGQYDALWSELPIGRSQRGAVWRWIDPLFGQGDSVLDLGCGTGVDAVHLMSKGVRVQAIDASGEMVGMAQSRGVHARHMAIENLCELNGSFDGVISNFGALNCVKDLDVVARELARLVRPGGHVALCTMGTVCAWEVCHFLRRGQPGKAFRRWRPGGTASKLGAHVTYPSIAHLAYSFHRDFRLVQWSGIGLFVPPSYVEDVAETRIARLAERDRRWADLPLLRMFADHRLLIFERI